MRSNETRLVELSYTTATTMVSDPSGQISYSEPERTPDSDLEGDISIRIDSSAFAIAPANQVSKGPGVPLPVNITWMITPKAEGNHYLLVSVHQRLGDDVSVLRERPTNVEVQLNDERLAPDPSGAYRLPVKVSTIYGVSQRTIGLAGLAAGLLGFLATWDILLPFIKRFVAPETRGAIPAAGFGTPAAEPKAPALVRKKTRQALRQRDKRKDDSGKAADAD